jgi:alkaline phosphatase D
VTWDDHEVQNDYASDRGEDLSPGFVARRAAGYQAWWEHMPLPKRMRPRDASLRVHDRYDWGALARFHVLDDRQYRDYHACPPPGRGGSTTVDLADCPDLARPGRRCSAPSRSAGSPTGSRSATRAGTSSRSRRSSRRSRGRAKAATGPTAGRAIRARATASSMPIVERKARDTVVLSGDVHCNYLCDLKRRVDDPPGAVIATEVCGTSISSSGLAQERIAAVLPLNPHIRYARADERGYVALKAGSPRIDVALRVVSDVLDPNATVRTAARFAVEAGRPGIQAA